MEPSHFLAQAKHLLQTIRKRMLPPEQKRQLAIELAGMMLEEACRILSHQDRQRQAQLARMMNDPAGKVFAARMTDECFRSRRPQRIADQLIYLLHQYGTPQFLSWHKRILFYSFMRAGRRLSAGMVPLLKRKIRQESRGLILPEESKALLKHIRKRTREGVRVNLNHIGEAVLGEEEAQRRLTIYLEDLRHPDIECISIKVSTIYSQINLIGWQETLEILGDRLKQLYREAQNHYFVRRDGTKATKFVYLDMEEYHDLHLTVEVFRQVLDDPEFFRYSAGIVLQSYLPEAFLLQQDLTAWAMQRVQNGGAPIKIRIAKGANLAMEQVEASLKGWPQAPYLHKIDTDANYKRMVSYGSEPVRAKAVHLGIASHNLFDIAYAMVLRAEKGIERYVGFEMLEGMADHLQRVVKELSGEMLLYCPTATQSEFQHAIAYLTRRLDENTAEDSFLRHAFSIRVGNEEWNQQAEIFAAACHAAPHVDYAPRRQQNRFEVSKKPKDDAPFNNEPETDWSLPQNQKWAEMIVRKWSTRQVEQIPLMINGINIIEGVEWIDKESPSSPGYPFYQYAAGNDSHLEMTLNASVTAFKQWSARPAKDRLLLIDEAAHQLRLKRADLIGAMAADVGKIIAEADTEVSEAVDFASYYRRSVEEMLYINDLQFTPKGTIVVTPPWNFPCSIPAGCILAALAAGNAVIFKPAPEAVLVGWTLVNALWKAGIGNDILQFFCCRDEPTGSHLLSDERVAAVMLTGATATAKQFLRLRPGMDLIAETGGKNTMIITSMADRDLAIKDLLQSAFGYAGQKCSACSLAILEKEVYHDPGFRRQLRDAAASLKMGSPWNLSTTINPLIRMPSSHLLRALTTLENGEKWLLEPQKDPQNPWLWSPGIKFGVNEGSFTHRTEFFGPVLGVMCAKDLQEALRLANGTPYGLTAGIHTLDDREKQMWQENIIAGNHYINRTITGAIVRRQPFGGCKESSFGAGYKAGGPNYVLQLMKAETKDLPKLKEPLCDAVMLLDQHALQNVLTSQEGKVWSASLGNYAFYWNHHFSLKQDPSKVLGQDNIFSYVVRDDITLRVSHADRPLDILRAVAAAMICQAPLQISCSTLRNDIFHSSWMSSYPPLNIIEESDTQLKARLAVGSIKRLRFLSLPHPSLVDAAAASACYLDTAPVMANGRLELLRFMREVSLSHDYHRYGYLGEREYNQPDFAGIGEKKHESPN